MSQFEINAYRAALGDVRHRKNILNCSEAELIKIRAAFAAVYGITNRDDDRGYQYWAGKHGRPEAACDHGQLFLPWHRAYLYGLEKAMQYHVPNVTLPYWNWSGPATLLSDALPDPCTTETMTNGSVNPLLAGPIYFRESDGTLIDRRTVRGNRTTPSYAALRQDVAGAFEEQEFLPFQGEINGPHGRLHLRVGGDMGSFDHAGYDPIFWMHHANVDRQWGRWQRSHDGAVVPRLDYSLPGMGMTVGKTVDHRGTLGFDYVANECFERFDRDDVAAGLRTTRRWSMACKRSSTRITARGASSVIEGPGLLYAGQHIARWISLVPREISEHITLEFPGAQKIRGTDHLPFVCAGAPAFLLFSLQPWAEGQGEYVHHTNRDTYDKIVFDDLKENATLAAMLAYAASEDPERFPRDRAVLPIDPDTGEPRRWFEVGSGSRHAWVCDPRRGHEEKWTPPFR